MQEVIQEIYNSSDGAMKKQLALILAEHAYYDLVDDEEVCGMAFSLLLIVQDDELQELMGNVKRTDWFQNV